MLGERPIGCQINIKTVADLARSNSELEKRLGVVPDEYDFKKSKYLDPDYVPFQELRQVAKDKRVPQEVMDKMLESVDKYMDEFSIDYKEEIKKLVIMPKNESIHSIIGQKQIYQKKPMKP